MFPPHDGVATEGLFNLAFATQNVVLFGFGFSSAWMLAWVAGAAVPIVLHLLNQRTRGSVRWAAMRLLQQVIEKESKRIRFEQLILLLIRTLIFCVLAFALARPFLGSPLAEMQEEGNRQPRLWILVIDCSYSMDYQSGGQSRLDEAKMLAIETVDQAAENDAFALI
ncbi:MAG: BatA domain-containing protein, partial [Planctomycetota bacterium]